MGGVIFFCSRKINKYIYSLFFSAIMVGVGIERKKMCLFFGLSINCVLYGHPTVLLSQIGVWYRDFVVSCPRLSAESLTDW